MGQPAASPADAPTLSFSSAIPPRMSVRRRWLHGSIAAGLVAASFAMGWVGHGARSLSSASANLDCSDRRETRSARRAVPNPNLATKRRSIFASRPVSPRGRLVEEQSPPTVKERRQVGGAIAYRHQEHRGGRADPGRPGNHRAMAQKSTAAGHRVSPGRRCKGRAIRSISAGDSSRTPWPTAGA